MQEMKLTDMQSFEKERMSRVIREETDLQAIKDVALKLLDGWFSQRAASTWLMAQAMGAPPLQIKPTDVLPKPMIDVL